MFTSDPRTVLAEAERYTASEDTPSAILDYGTDIVIDESGQLSRTTRIVQKIYRLSGVEAAQTITLRWSLARENKPVFKGRVITGDGQAHVLENSGIVERDPDEQDLVGTVKLLRVKLPAVDIDSIIELEIQQSDKVAAMPGVRFGLLEPPPLVPIGRYHAIVTSLGAGDLHVESRDFPGVKISPVPAPKGRAFSIESSRFVVRSPAQQLPPDVSPYPLIAFGNVPSWQTVARWYAGVLDKTLPHEIKADATPPKDRLGIAEKSWEEVRKQVRDNGLDLTNAPLTPRTASEIVKAGSGSGLEMAIVLMDKLAAAGLSSKLALFDRAPQPDVLRSLPGFEAFHHVLVYVDGPTPLWMDPAADYASVAHLPVADQNRSALIVDQQSTELTHTPGSTEKDNVESVEAEIRPGDGYPTKMSEVVEADGSFADALLPLLSKLAEPDADQHQLVQPLFRVGGGQRIESVKASSPHRLNEKSRLEIAGEGFAGATVSDEGGVIELPGAAALNFRNLTPLLAMNRDDPTQPMDRHRTMNYYVAPPFASQTSYRVIPPAGYRIKEPPPLSAETLGPMTITPVTVLDKDGILRLSWTITQPKTQLTPQEVEAMRAEFRKMAAKNLNVPVQLENVAEAKLQSGDYREALPLFKKDAAAEKETINPSLRLAGAYVVLGGRSAAIKLCEDLLKPTTKQADQAEALSGVEQARIYERLGWIYEHDEYGRMLSPGMDPAKAEENFRKAVEAGDGSAALAIADLEMYNAAGVRFGRGARLDDALAILNRIDLNTISRTGRLNEYALLLLRDHKYEQLAGFFSYPQADHADQSLKWAAFAASRPDSDLKLELDLSSLSPTDKHTLLVEAARRLIANRDYATAIRVFRFAGKGSGVSQTDLDLLARVRPFDESAASAQPAIAAFERYVYAIVDPDSVDGWKRFAAPVNQKNSLEAQRYALLHFFAPVTGGALPPEFWAYGADIINTTLNFSADGSDATGYRVKAFIAGNGLSVPVAYVVKSDNRYLVAGLAHSNAPVTQAVASARAGNVAAARQWLNWAREDSGRSSLTDSEFQHALDVATGSQLLQEDKPAEAVAVFLKAHNQDPGDLNATYYLIESLIEANRTSEAKTEIDRMATTDAAVVLAQRLRAHLAAQEKNFPEAIDIEKRLASKPNATALDWNDLAWVSLFVPQSAADAQGAAEKAADLTKSDNAAILHTLAVAQAANGHLKDAIASANKISVLSGDPSEMRTVFGGIAEQLGLSDAAIAYYAAVEKDSTASALSNYSFAQARLAALSRH